MRLRNCLPFLLVIVQTSFSQTRFNNVTKLTTAGFEISQPTYNSGIKGVGYMYGPRIQIAGIGEIGYSLGNAVTSDNKFYTKSSQYYMGFQFPFLLLKKSNVNFGPIVGLRFMAHESVDPYHIRDDFNEAGFGVAVPLGLMIKLGPINVSAKYHFQAVYNFSKGTALKGTTAYPSVSVAFSPMNLFMNPKDFSHTGLTSWMTNYNKELLGYKATYTTEGTAYSAVYLESWTQHYGNHTEKATDVQPYFFIGPRANTNYTSFNKKKVVSGIGINMGFRRGLWFLNSFYEKSDVNFNEPVSRQSDSTSYRTPSNPYHSKRTDGSFENSTRFGGQIGIELVNLGLGKKFIYAEDKRKMKRVTSHYYCAPFFGYGKVQLGKLKFNSDSSEIAYQSYLDSLPIAERNTVEKNIYLSPKSLDFYTIGVQAGIGAVAFNAEYNIYQKTYKKLNTINIGLALNIPIIRVGRAMKAAVIMNKQKKKLKRELKTEKK